MWLEGDSLAPFVVTPLANVLRALECVRSAHLRASTHARLHPGWRLTRALPMHRLAQVGPADTLLDVGCGDGRVVVAAAALCGCCATGVEIEARVVALAQRALEAWAPQSALSEACFLFLFLVALLRARSVHKHTR